MHYQTLISILVWVVVLCSIRVKSDTTGWRSIGVQILKKKKTEVVDPISEILIAISLNQMPVDESNVLKRHKDIATVLMCKYSEIIFNYKYQIIHFIRVCQNEKDCSDSYQSYYDCFQLLLTKLHSMSPRFKCMMDALDFIYSLYPQNKTKYKGIGVMEATDKLTEYTLTIGPTLSSKLSEQGTTVDVVDYEINLIGHFISEVYKKNISRFTYRHCNIQTNRKWTENTLVGLFLFAKSSQMIPQETTMLQYIVDEMDSYANEILSKWFNDLGFAYGVEDKVIIRTN
ncbi:uncharacterized protein LOC126847732 [Adelges cooleyi]|uniref:uncharacterized protein LOC126847732 n=1 Tax=Adelges cooleyi TaxID=133065 RepID=UPI00218076C5|nr:uncharacterized protein LOC126847732 [Adelges cooleyi]